MSRSILTELFSLLLCIFILPLSPAEAEDVSRLELRLNKALTRFPDADSNGDGKLTIEEFEAYRATMRKERKPPVSSQVPPSPMKRYTQAELESRYESREFQGVRYRWFAPVVEEGRKYPMILSLHGAGGKGTDNRRNLKVWNGVITESGFQEKYPCFIVAPQSDGPWRVAGSAPDVDESVLQTYPETWRQLVKRGRGWLDDAPNGNLGTVFELLDHLAAGFPIDSDRVYVLGHSMGGFGSFEAVAMAPDRFAAAIPSAGGLLPWHDVARFSHVPIWAFHGDADGTVPFDLSQIVFDQMKEAGGVMKLTRLGEVAHNANAYAFVFTGDDMSETFETFAASDACDPTSDVWEWLFRQERER